MLLSDNVLNYCTEPCDGIFPQRLCSFFDDMNDITKYLADLKKRLFAVIGETEKIISDFMCELDEIPCASLSDIALCKRQYFRLATLLAPCIEDTELLITSLTRSIELSDEKNETSDLTALEELLEQCVRYRKTLEIYFENTEAYLEGEGSNISLERIKEETYILIRKIGLLKI